MGKQYVSFDQTIRMLFNILLDEIQTKFILLQELQDVARLLPHYFIGSQIVSFLLQEWHEVFVNFEVSNSYIAVL